MLRSAILCSSEILLREYVLTMSTVVTAEKTFFRPGARPQRIRRLGAVKLKTTIIVGPWISSHLRLDLKRTLDNPTAREVVKRISLRSCR